MDPSKDQVPKVALPLLGNIEDWSLTDKEDVFVVRPKEERIAEIRTTVCKLLLAKSCPKSDAASLRGRLIHVGGASAGRTGRSNHFNLGLFAEGVLVGWSDLLERELIFLLEELGRPKARKYRLSNQIEMGCRCWTDASFEPTDLFPKMRLCAIAANSSARVGVVCDIPDELYPLLVPRKTQIVIGEMLAVCLLFRFFPDQIRNGSNIMFIDNMGVIHSIVNGSSSSIDLCAFASALQQKCTQLDSINWWEYVASASNISDGGSRVGTTCKMAAEAKIHLSTVEFKLPPSGFPWCRPSDWEPWWNP